MKRKMKLSSLISKLIKNLISCKDKCDKFSQSCEKYVSNLYYNRNFINNLKR